MLAINMEDITKIFPGTVANDKVNFKVESGTIHSLLGENGAGKSTLMKVLFGLYTPEQGRVYINDKLVENINPNKAYNLGIGMVHQHFMLVDNLTVLENIILGAEPGKGFSIDRANARTVLKELSEKYGFELELEKKVRELSVGQKQRVEIMKTLYRGAKIIILDEPTAVLTPLEVNQLLKILKDMRSEGKTIVFITHKLAETMEVSDEVTILRQGKSICTIKTKDTNEKELAKLMVGEDINLSVKKEDNSKYKTKFSLKNVKLLSRANEKVSIEIRGGEILGIAGVDGNGQQELEEIIMGIRPCTTGSIHMLDKDITKCSVRNRRKLGIGYIPADRWKYGVVQSMSLKDNYLLGHQFEENRYIKKGLIEYNKIDEVAKDMMKRFDIKAVNTEQKMGSLSGGNQQKIVLSRELASEPEVIIVSQPTRGLDIGAINNIKKTLLDLRLQGKAILLISAELSEIFELSDRIAVLFKGKIMATKPTEEFNNESISLLMAGKEENR